MNFGEAEEYLFSLGNEVDTMKLGLANITTLLAALGSPQTVYPKVQIAGTNGKGSVCAFLNSICLQAGIKTGMYTSPHLISIRERIKTAGSDISEEDFARLATRIREMAESLVAGRVIDIVPTFFEQVTAIALLAFAESKVELAILETGLGGRLDATTAAEADVAVITRIDLDHQEYLGNTIEEIAAEKSAIIREDSSVVIGAQGPEAFRVLRDHCEALGVRPSDEIYSKWTVSADGPDTVKVNTTRHISEGAALGLKGRHQIENAETAINAVKVLRYEMGFDIDVDQILDGLEKARHPGRLEQIGNFILDGAHNPAGAAALRDYLVEFVEPPITLIFGAMRDKSAREMLDVLVPLADLIILTKPDNTRALEPKALRGMLPEGIAVALTDTVEEAIHHAAGAAGNGIIAVTGSLYLVGEAKRIMEEHTAI